MGYHVAIVGYNTEGNEQHDRESSGELSHCCNLHDSDRNNHHHDKGIRIDYLRGKRGQGKEEEQKQRICKKVGDFPLNVFHYKLNCFLTVANTMNDALPRVHLVVNSVNTL